MRGLAKSVSDAHCVRGLGFHPSIVRWETPRFGWNLARSFKLPIGVSIRGVVAQTAKILGESMCGKTESLAQGVKDKCHNNPGSVECATVLLAYNAADKCAGEKYDDAIKCHHTCGWAKPWGWLGIFIHEHDGSKKNVAIKTAYAPIYLKISQLQTCIFGTMCFRTVVWVVMNMYAFWNHVQKAQEAENQDDEYAELSGEELEDMKA